MGLGGGGASIYIYYSNILYAYFIHLKLHYILINNCIIRPWWHARGSKTLSSCRDKKKHEKALTTGTFCRKDASMRRCWTTKEGALSSEPAETWSFSLQDIRTENLKPRNHGKPLIAGCIPFNSLWEQTAVTTFELKMSKSVTMEMLKERGIRPSPDWSHTDL